MFSPVSDDEYVAKIRKGLEFWDRCRFWFLALFVLLLGGVIWLGNGAMGVLNGMMPANAPMAWLGFCAGIVIGVFFSTMFHQLVNGIISMLAGFRSDRLMVEYYDRLNAQPSGNGGNKDDFET